MRNEDEDQCTYDDYDRNEHDDDGDDHNDDDDGDDDGDNDDDYDDENETDEIVERLQLLAPRLRWGQVWGEGGRPV